MTMVERLRAEVPQPEADDLRVEEARLMAAIADSRPVRRGFPLPRRVVVPLLAAAMTIKAMGVREEYIFDPRTYQYLGERTVVDSGPLKTPVGSVLTASALLKVSVADTAPAPRR
ncbi:hypothetical protein D0T12_05675 [Actinomadura spongiicola]|uniref:Uncharacterized protein n=2 Tax=Actinomadura spongiicola TaxID=2303421 RepID=A0A372GL52_9ACTN|nr:hypothetical protein D0T12_05675 [Actinomadura spongiicola]